MELFRRLLATALALGLMAGNAGKISDFYDQTVANAQHLATATDLRAIGTMLDYGFMQTGRYPSKEHFAQWMTVTFKENPGQPLGHDHWGNALVYTTGPDRKTFELASPGPDGQHRTADDLSISGP